MKLRGEMSLSLGVVPHAGGGGPPFIASWVQRSAPYRHCGHARPRQPSYRHCSHALCTVMIVPSAGDTTWLAHTLSHVSAPTYSLGQRRPSPVPTSVLGQQR